ncbi:MAG: hypothetical protein QNJ67_14120 [Kiloniellales bacterium]|nr:hypothetical protein [Kiloniellales bacterium]
MVIRLSALVGVLVAAALIAGSAPAAAQKGLLSYYGAHEQSLHAEDPSLQAEGVLAWDSLANLNVRVETPAPLQTIFLIEFPAELLDLEGEVVRIRGFMYALESGDAHTRFLLSARPPACPFCLPGTAKTLVDIRSENPIRFTQRPVLLEGRFAILEDDDSGLYYRLADASLVD